MLEFNPVIVISKKNGIIVTRMGCLYVLFLFIFEYLCLETNKFRWGEHCTKCIIDEWIFRWEDAKIQRDEETERRRITWVRKISLEKLLNCRCRSSNLIKSCSVVFHKFYRLTESVKSPEFVPEHTQMIRRSVDNSEHIRYEFIVASTMGDDSCRSVECVDWKSCSETSARWCCR